MKTYTTLDAAAKAFSDHICTSESGICTHEFVFPCPTCEIMQHVHGKNMAAYEGAGECPECIMTPSPVIVCMGESGESMEQAAEQATEIYRNLVGFTKPSQRIVNTTMATSPEGFAMYAYCITAFFDKE